ncbi:MAG: LAGLIDADG family homing endonuclease, partial [Candidatus Methylomirabilales bacterium]
MADTAVRERIKDLPQEALDYFENDELRARCFIEKYALWDLKDQLKETHPTQMWARVAQALAAPEKDPDRWFEEFSWLLSDFRFVPGGRVLHGAGNPRKVTLTNCLVGETIVATDMGYRYLAELAAEDRPFKVRIDGESRWASAWRTGYRETVVIRTREGFTAESTPDHRFRLADGSWVRAENLKPGDKLALYHDERPYGEEKPGDFLRGYAAGLFVGDGTFAGTKFSVANVRLFHPKGRVPILAVADHCGATVLEHEDHVALNSRTWAEDLEEVGIVRGRKTVTDQVLKQSSGYMAGFLRGLFDADAHVDYKHSRRIVLGQSDLELLRRVQVMLLGFGIKSHISADMRPFIISRFPKGEYRCRPVHRLLITRKSFKTFYERIGFSHPEKDEKAREGLKSRLMRDLWDA